MNSTERQAVEARQRVRFHQKSRKRLGSSDKQTVLVSRTWRSPAQSSEVATEHDLFPEILSGVAEETRNSSQAILDDGGFEGSGEVQSPHVEGSREAGPPRKSSSTNAAQGLEVEEGQQARQHQRQGEGDRRPRSCRPPNWTRSSTRFGVRLGDEVRNWQDSGEMGGICPRILRLERLVRKQQHADLGTPFFSENPRVGETRRVGKYVLLLSDFLRMRRGRMIRSLRSLKSEQQSGQPS